ncbi:MAG: CCA tRNA nucleotidyltransferase [Chloroflexota bacterium]
MAVISLPGPELTTDIAAAIPASVHDLLRTLWTNGHAAFVVGGSLRDVLLGRDPGDWDLTTSALPEHTQSLFPRARYENAFGTVAVETEDPVVGLVEITTMRSDHAYADHRRPHHVEFTKDIEADLARRDLTVNAIAWGTRSADEAPTVVDPYDGREDLAAGVLRAVGDARTRFEEDALRMLRAVRLASTLGFGIEAATLAGIQAKAGLVGHLSGERIAEELRLMLAAPVPSVGLQLLSDTGLLEPISPALAQQRGIPQNKIVGEDLWDHTLRAVDGASPQPPYIRLAALLHDIGKPASMADGRFLGHDALGADLADELLDRLRWPRKERDRVVHLVRQHMYGYVPDWSDAAVRRFIAKIGPDELHDLFLLREADNVGSGRPRDGGGLAEIRARVDAQLAAGVVLSMADLAIDGDDLMAAFDLTPSPRLGAILHDLLNRAIADPSINTRERLLAVARAIVEPGAPS